MARLVEEDGIEQEEARLDSSPMRCEVIKRCGQAVEVAGEGEDLTWRLKVRQAGLAFVRVRVGGRVRV